MMILYGKRYISDSNMLEILTSFSVLSFFEIYPTDWRLFKTSFNVPTQTLVNCDHYKRLFFPL